MSDNNPQVVSKASGLAVSSMILGIVGLALGWTGFFAIGLILAVVFGHVAIKKINESGSKGKGMAVAGLSMGYVGIGIGAIALIIGLSTAGSSSSSEANSDSNVEQTEQVVGVGATITGDGWALKLNSATMQKTGSFSSKPDNDFFLILDLTYTNSSEDSDALSSLLQFDMQGSDDYMYDQSFLADLKSSFDGDVLAGAKLRGQIAFDVKQLDSYKLSFKPGFLSDPVVFSILSSDIK
jgi:hypothetical protein